jgi:hypothetical protein
MTHPVWMVFPSCNIERAKNTVRLWRKAGYSTLCIMNPDMGECGADIETHEEFRGYWDNSNRWIVSIGDKASAVVLAADDLEPDPNADPIHVALEMQDHFAETKGYGAMQPTGDDKNGMDGVWRICGSPWFTPQWIAEAYGGNGPCPYVGFYHSFYGDEEIFNVAKAQGVLWQRPDLSQFHRHWCRNDEHKTKRTEYQLLSSDQWWDKDKAAFMGRMAQGFPGSARKA